MSWLSRNRSALAGGAGLALLAVAFAWRWLAPDWSAEPPAGTLSPLPGLGVVVPTPVDLVTLPEESIDNPPAEAPVPEARPPEPPSPASGEVADALARAALAEQQGRLLAPADDSALYWYDLALAADSADRSARDGRARVIAAVVAAADRALDAGDAGAADDAIAALGAVPDGGAEIERLQRRRAVQADVAALLRQGAQRMAAGARFEPAGQSALDSYRAALELDPASGVARKGLAEVEQAILGRALAAATEDAFDDADRLLALAGSVLAGTQAQLTARGRIVELKTARANDLVARAETALGAGNTEAAEAFVERAVSLGASGPAVDAIDARLRDARLYGSLVPGQRIADAFVDREGSGPDLVVVPVGRFEMGSPDRERNRKAHEGPRHAVEIAEPFALGRTEVTVAEFGRFIADTRYVTDAERRGGSAVYDERSGRIVTRAGAHWRSDFLGEEARADDPVVHVSHGDAQAYANWLAERTGKRYRLPTEAEFEYALRAGSTTRYWWGDGNPESVVGNFTGDGDRSRSRRGWTRSFPRYSDGWFGPAPVGSYAANPFGVHDVDGNVSEWVEDCWHDSYLRAPADGSAWVNPGCARRVIRGASWGSAPDQVRSASRLPSPPDVTSARTGFRVARAL